MPDDTTPHGGEIMHSPPDRARIPEPEPGHAAKPRSGTEDASLRPPLPDHPVTMAADVEDEEADPVIDSGPGIADEHGDTSVTRQPGG
jgi:hypothetical protein